MVTHLKWTMRVLRMLMHLSSGHATLLRNEFQLSKCSPNQTYGAGRTHVGLRPKFLVFLRYEISELRRETFTQEGKCVRFYNTGPEFRGALHKKNLGQEHARFTQFQTIQTSTVNIFGMDKYI